MAGRRFTGMLVLLAALGFPACQREQRELPRIPGGAGAGVRQSELPGPAPAAAAVPNPYEGNQYAREEGKRLYHWYNCSGCHFEGGGGIGPPLMDDDWIYGGEPQNIFNTIMEGRPNGMPSYRGLLPRESAWQVVTYVRSLGEGEGEAEGGGSGAAEQASANGGQG